MLSPILRSNLYFSGSLTDIWRNTLSQLQLLSKS
jgi:hypothetical protein